MSPRGRLSHRRPKGQPRRATEEEVLEIGAIDCDAELFIEIINESQTCSAMSFLDDPCNPRYDGQSRSQLVPNAGGSLEAEEDDFLWTLVAKFSRLAEEKRQHCQLMQTLVDQMGGGGECPPKEVVKDNASEDRLKPPTWKAGLDRRQWRLQTSRASCRPKRERQRRGRPRDPPQRPAVDSPRDGGAGVWKGPSLPFGNSRN
ncbi:uncharacterized protein LOC133554786 [Nerophis ophidion]|uniref:uncharacterized protein LOC133554786 n=1 Tax=Nerophis ophidion TaxID=159077 RepID=UPI002ADF3FDA|nr:uncharacterized protein LOC133554786 [Nerophis ophidion]